MGIESICEKFGLSSCNWAEIILEKPEKLS